MGSSPHYHVLISDDDNLHRIAINVKSQMAPSELFYDVIEDFKHPMIEELETLESGFTLVESIAAGMAIDFIRGNVVNPAEMKPLAHNIAGPDNDLNELIHKYVLKAISMENSAIYAFGEQWGPEPKRDKYFGFKPGSGIHDIHMNQGNATRWQKDDAIWQDGAILFHFPDEAKWVGIFLAFQSQCFHTDDTHGHRIPNLCSGTTKKPAALAPSVEDNTLRIIAAVVNPAGQEEGKESVTLFNLSAEAIDLNGWSLADRKKNREPLHGKIEAGESKKVLLSGKQARMPNKGGIITLLDTEGTKIDGVSYTKKEALKEGWTVLFK